MIHRNQKEVLAELQKMRESKTKAFRILMNQTLYAEIKKDDFNILHRLEARVGLCTETTIYSNDGYFVEYRDAEYLPDHRPLTSLEKIVDYVGKQALSGDKKIAFSCTETQAALLRSSSDPSEDPKDSKMWRLGDLAAQTGILDFTYSVTGGQIFVLYIEKYYPGTAIITAVRKNDYRSLSEREKQTLNAARKYAASCKGRNDWETALNIHDHLCRTIVYTIDDSKDDDDTAIGAILDGKANCDGYADAFYLIGTLAGLQIGYVHGKKKKDSEQKDYKTHMWNTLKLNGTWRMVDVTWDNNIESKLCCHTFFDLGYDRASLNHLWNEDMYHMILDKTDIKSRPDNEYYINDMKDVSDSVRTAYRKKLKYFTLVFVENPSEGKIEDARGQIQRVFGSYLYSWDERMRSLYIYL